MIYNETSSMVKGLLAFNLGVEAGQILIIAAFLMLSSFLLLFVKKKRSLVIAVSLFAGFVATYLIADKLFA
jgi:LPXTG-motif cell wall-anchored protein